MPRNERLLILLILFLGTGLRFWGLSFGLPYPDARPDELTVVAVSAGLLYAGLNPHFFHWPSFEFYVVSAIYRVGWEVGHLRGIYRLKFDMFRHAAVHAAPFLMVPRMLAAAAGIATIWLIYRLADLLFDRITAITAAFFVAVAFLHIRDSHFGVTDTPMTALAVATLLPLAAVLRDPARFRSWIMAGVLAGLAASTKYNGGLIVVAGIAAAIALLVKGDRTVRLATLRGLTLLLGASVVAFICGTPFAILDARHFLEGLRFDASHLVEGHGIVLGRGWIYHLTFSLWYGLGAPLLIAGLAGIGVLAITSWRKAIVVCAFPLLYYFVVGRGYTVFVRYMTPVVPFLCITAAISIVEVMRRLAPPALVSGMVTAAAILIALPSLQRAFAFDRLIAQKDTRVLAEEWTAAHVPAAAWIAQTPPVVPYLDFGAPRPARFATFDPGRGLFVSTEGSVVVPEWITLPASPLSVYTTVPAELQAIAQRDYVPVETIAATHGPELSTWFDQQDEFFVPFTNFTMRDRPGPEIQILRRR